MRFRQLLMVLTVFTVMKRLKQWISNLDRHRTRLYYKSGSKLATLLLQKLPSMKRYRPPPQFPSNGILETVIGGLTGGPNKRPPYVREVLTLPVAVQTGKVLNSKTACVFLTKSIHLYSPQQNLFSLRREF